MERSIESTLGGILYDGRVIPADPVAVESGVFVVFNTSDKTWLQECESGWGNSFDYAARFTDEKLAADIGLREAPRGAALQVLALRTFVERGA